jgi:mRNA interferase RelE/StbE
VGARRGTYRVLYEIDDEDRVVTVTAIEHRADAYRSR